MIHEKLAALLSRKLAGEASEEDLIELDDWIRKHPEDQFFIQLMHEYWTPDTTPLLDRERSTSLFNRIVETPQEKKGKPLRRKWLGWLAAACLLTGLFLAIGLSKREQAKDIVSKQQAVVTYRGVRSTVFLPDGSKVWLNADSKIYYDSLFTGPKREVTLVGEAFFDIVRDNGRPFVVNAGNYVVKVLGTAFNVKAYPTDTTMETTLIRGKVEVLTKDAAVAAVLTPHQKLVLPAGPGTTERGEKINTSDKIITIKPTIDTELVETAWVQNRLVFEETSFRELAVKLERWFDVKITFESETVGHYRLNGAFENESINEVLSALQEIEPFEFKINGKYVTISK